MGERTEIGRVKYSLIGRMMVWWSWDWELGSGVWIVMVMVWGLGLLAAWEKGDGLRDVRWGRVLWPCLEGIGAGCGIESTGLLI